MSRPEDRDAMMAPQDPSAENKGRNTRDPVNWTVHGGNLQAVGGRPVKKKATDTPPDDLLGGLPTASAKLPPTIVTHNEAGLTTGSHSADDERFSNREAADLKEGGEASINDETPIALDKNVDNVNNQETDAAKSQASLDAYKAQESAEDKAKREEMERLEILTNPNAQPSVNQNTNETSSTPTSDAAKKAAKKPSDPVLTTR